MSSRDMGRGACGVGEGGEGRERGLEAAQGSHLCTCSAQYFVEQTVENADELESEEEEDDDNDDDNDDDKDRVVM